MVKVQFRVSTDRLSFHMRIFSRDKNSYSPVIWEHFLSLLRSGCVSHWQHAFAAWLASLEDFLIALKRFQDRVQPNHNKVES